MDKRQNNDASCSRQPPRDSERRPPFEPFPVAASLKPLRLELGSIFSSSFHPARMREDAPAESNYSQGRLLETNSSLTPLDLYLPSSSRTCGGQGEGRESTSGITPQSWASLFSDFRVPSLSNVRETLKSNSTARSVPRDGRLGSSQDDYHRHSGRLGPDDSEGEQRVPVHNFSSGESPAAEAQNLFQAESSQFSNSWPVEVRGLLGKTLTCGGEGGGSIAYDRGSFTASRQGPKLTLGHRNEVGPSGSSPFFLPSIVHNNRTIHIPGPVPSYAFQRLADGFKVKEKSEMNSEDRGTKGKPFSTSATGIPVEIAPAVESSRRKFPDEPQGLSNNMGAVRGDCEDFGGKYSSNWKDVSAEDAQPMDVDAEPICSLQPGFNVGSWQASEGEKAGQKQSRHRNSSGPAHEAGPFGFTKRSRQFPIDSFREIHGHDLEQVPQLQREQANGWKTGKSQSCNWLQRWLQPDSILLTSDREGRSKVDSHMHARK